MYNTLFTSQQNPLHGLQEYLFTHTSSCQNTVLRGVLITINKIAAYDDVLNIIHEYIGNKYIITTLLMD